MAAIVDAIIYSSNEHLIKTFKEQLQLKNSANISEMNMESDLLSAVDRFPSGFFVLDWEAGQIGISSFLKRCMQNSGLASRPVLIVANEATTALISVAIEYGVTHVHIGAIESKAAASSIGQAMRKTGLKSIFRDETDKLRKARQQNDYPTLVRILSKLLEKNPDNLYLKAELGEAYLLMDNAKEAIKILAPKAESNPPNTRYLHVYGRALMKVGIFNEAASVFSKISVLNPYDPDKLVFLGESMLELGEIDRAGDAFDQALEMEPGHAEALKGKGKVLLIEGDINDALELVQDIANPYELAGMFNSAAILLMRNQDFGKGMKLYQSALKSVGGNRSIQARLFFNMGVGYRRQKDPVKAKTCFEQALKLNPNHGIARNNLAQMERALKKPDLTLVHGDALTANEDPLGYRMESEDQITLSSESQPNFDSFDGLGNGGDDDLDSLGLEETIFK